MTYSGPTGPSVPKPPLDFLERIIFHERSRCWRVGSGTSGLSVVEHKRGKAVRAVDGEPALVFFLVERHGFFFTHFQPGRFVEQFVPFAGGPSRPWVEHVVGGLEMYVPRACFVSPAFGWEIVQEFLRSRSRSRAVRWVKRTSLDFPSPEERKLSKAELS